MSCADLLESASYSLARQATTSMRERERIGQRQIKSLQPGEVVWDSAVIGFGARRQRSDAVSYFVFYRTAEGRQRWAHYRQTRHSMGARYRTGRSAAPAGRRRTRRR